MEMPDGQHAWLYQYKSSMGAEWLKKLRKTRQVDWRIVRWAEETRIGDLIFFWESGADGGLRGWGTVKGELRSQLPENDRRRVWRVLVQVSVWLPTVIPGKKVLNYGAFLDENLYLSMAQGANFPLEPQEAKALLALMPPSAKAHEYLGRLLPHPPSVPSALQLRVGASPKPYESDEAFSDEEDGALTGSWSGAPNRSPTRIEHFLGFGLTPAAEMIVQEADYRRRKISGPISTTRLFLAALDPDAWPRSVPLTSQEGAVYTALQSVAKHFQAPLRQLHAHYLNDQTPGLSAAALDITDNARRLFTRAWQINSAAANAQRLPADLLVAALVTVDEGVVLERLKRVGLSLRDLQQQMQRSLAVVRPDLVTFWRNAIGGGGAQGVLVSPLTNGMPVAVVGNDNAWNKGQKDSLGADREAQAFAALTLSTHFVPPLAVGVFGDWGSGKSFFMRLVYEHIERLSAEARQPKGPKELLGEVVQIRFNAWHYVDTNLWASLVDHIFTELDKSTDKDKRSTSEILFEQLTTARELTIESAERLIQRRKEQEGAARSVAEAERKLLQKQSSIGTSPQVYWEAVKSEFRAKLSPNENRSLVRAAERLGMPGLIDDGKALSDAIHQLEEQRGRANLLARGLRSQLGSWWNVALFIGVCLVVAAVLSGLRHFGAMALGDSVKEIWSQSVITTSSIIVAITSVFAAANTQVKRALSSLQSLREKFNLAAKDALESPTAEVTTKQEELARLTADVAEGRARLAVSTEKLGEAARDYNAGTGKGRLLSFVRSRAANKDYAKHLGLVATIRKDFEELSDLIAAATSPKYTPEPELERERAAYSERVRKLLDFAREGDLDLLSKEEREKLEASAENKKPADLASLNRIVLYIDDLDRCRPEKVAEVLQAVHLLLSFRLFVVFVAVDVRWVTRALRTSYPSLITKSSVSGGSAGATAYDYLEKIFQIPYWVRPMTAQSSETFMADRLSGQRSALAARNSIQEVGAVGQAGNTGASVEEVGNSANVSIFDDASENRDAIGGSLGTEVSEVVRQLIPHVDLSAEEQKFMTELSRWAGDSPRRLLRFMNVYQVMKASFSTDDVVENDQSDFHEIMAQVAIATATPKVLDDWLRILEEESPSEFISAVLQKMKAPTEPGGKSARPDRHLLGILDALVKESPWSTVEAVKRAARLTQRFSFGAEPLELDTDASAINLA